MGIPEGDRLGVAIIAVVAVGLRLWARKIQRIRLGPSDYSIIVGLVSTSTEFFINI